MWHGARGHSALWLAEEREYESASALNSSNLCVSRRGATGFVSGDGRLPSKIICADAARADLSEGTVYYLFNPFGKDTLRDFLANLETSISRDPRKVKVVYYNPIHESVLKASGWLTKFDEFSTWSGVRVTYWKSCRAALAPTIPRSRLGPMISEG